MSTDSLPRVGVGRSTHFPLRKWRSSIASSRRSVQKKSTLERALIIVRIRQGGIRSRPYLFLRWSFLQSSQDLIIEIRAVCLLAGEWEFFQWQKGRIAFLESKYPPYFPWMYIEPYHTITIQTHSKQTKERETLFCHSKPIALRYVWFCFFVPNIGYVKQPARNGK